MAVIARLFQKTRQKTAEDSESFAYSSKREYIISTNTDAERHHSSLEGAGGLTSLKHCHVTFALYSCQFSDSLPPSAPDTEEVRDSSKQADRNSQYSVQALFLLAEVMAPLLDAVYGSEDKDKVAPLLMSVMTHVTPYLKNHSAHNAPSYRACSRLLASVSEYQYTRRAWRREVFELLLEPAFFQTDAACLHCWRGVVDHLMTQDKTTFKDLMGE
ncbi:PREDICTED: protein dopey-1-like [Priapulus caudatus]|uniref:Protein dopey-1-like n=1 Tax=Priapulus caudatus TaxID=37621 RepID=A0ABM1EZH3_PRICU|nr:PREDICTED: protein dopey-1-like [Priapulus caudatus]